MCVCVCVLLLLLLGFFFLFFYAVCKTVVIFLGAIILLKSNLRMFSLNCFITTSNFILISEGEGGEGGSVRKNEANRFCFALTLWPQPR